jgi:methylglutamate dehydrogenase subunit D
VFAPERRSILAGSLGPGRHGAPDGIGVQLREVHLDAVEVSARRGRKAEVRKLLESANASETAPGRHILIAEPGAPGALAARLTQELGAAAAVVDIGHGLAFLELAGPAARHVLAKLCRLDLHPCAFLPGQFARTLLGQIPATIWLIRDTPSFRLAVPLTLAQSFVHQLLEASAETGCDIAP